MKEYLLSLLVAAILISILGMLAPEGGLGKHLRLLLSLFLICVLISPLSSLPEKLQDFPNGILTFPWEDQEDAKEDYKQQLEESLSTSSKEYFDQALTQALALQFGIELGTVRCVTEWNDENGNAHPQRVTVLLSQSAIWKDPHAIQTYVNELLGCECVVALE